jgi:hypothetical protein
MSNESIGRLDEVGIGKEATSGTAVSVSKWVPKSSGSTYTPAVSTDFHPGTFGSIDAVNKGAVTRTMTEITIDGSPTDVTFGHILTALFGAAYACVKFPIPGSITGTYVEGELITQSTTSATGTLRRLDAGGSSKALYIEPVSGTFTSGNTLTGGTSGATSTGGTIETPSAIRHHVFRRANNNNHPAYSIYNHNLVGGTLDERALYCMLDSLDLEVMSDKFSTFSSKWMGKLFTSTTTQTPSYTAENYFFGKNATFKTASAFTGLDAASAVAVRRIKLTFTKKVEPYQAVGGTTVTSFHNTEWDMKGEFELLFNSTTYRDYVTAGTEQALRLTIANSTTIGSAANPTLQFDVPLAFFEKVDLPKPHGELLIQTLSFVAQKDPTRGFPAEALLINTQSTAY